MKQSKMGIGKLYKFKNGLSYMTNAFSEVTGKPLQNKDSSILLLVGIKNKGSGKYKTTTYSFLYENELYWHGFSKNSEHGREIETGNIFEEVIL